MKIILGLFLLALILLHQDFWWHDRYTPLIFGFVPVGLAWHVGISLAAGLLWFLTVMFAWPHELDDVEAEGGDQ